MPDDETTEATERKALDAARLALLNALRPIPAGSDALAYAQAYRLLLEVSPA